jgi:hypothetical protein
MFMKEKKTSVLLTEHVSSPMLKICFGTFFLFTDIYPCYFSDVPTFTTKPLLPTSFHVILHYCLHH